MDPQTHAGVDVGGKTSRVAIADPAGRVREEFTIPHSQEGFQEFFTRVERRRCELNLPVAVAMEGRNGYGRPRSSPHPDGLEMEPRSSQPVYIHSSC